MLRFVDPYGCFLIKAWGFFLGYYSHYKLNFSEGCFYFVEIISGMKIHGFCWGLSALVQAFFSRCCFFLMHIGGNNDHG